MRNQIHTASKQTAAPTLSPALTSKQPTRGLSAPFLFTSVRKLSSLIRVLMPSALSSFSSLLARDLNAPHVLHASIVTCVDDLVFAFCTFGMIGLLQQP